jgi:uncharacterized protein (UPF0332 family)
MSITPSALLHYANLISASNNDELTKRNVLSRAYYASYHRACEFVPPVRTDKKIGMHQKYINQLMANKNGTTERKLGEKLKSMYSRRITADYHLWDSIKIDAVPVQLSSAKALFELLENPPPAPIGESTVVPFKK